MKTVEIDQNRYDELLRKEAMLEAVERLYAKTTGYSFHEVVGYLFSEIRVSANEKA